MSGTMARDAGTRPLRVLVAIASYGTSNDRYLERIIQEYGSMSLDVHVVVLSNIEKSVPPDVECLVGLPTKNPWSLPFGHKKLFADRCERYDLFIYSEDDILITEDNLRAWLDVNVLLAEDEIAGFMRVEFGKDGTRSYPDVHGHFRWDPSSTRRRGNYALAHFTNEHAACYVLTREQLSRALRSGGFDVDPHEGKYDLLCTAEVDPMLRTTGAGFLSGAAAVPFFPITLRCSCLLLLWLWGCGQRAASSKLLASEKRHIHSLFA
jgi:hypothetical protein